MKKLLLSICLFLFAVSAAHASVNVLSGNLSLRQSLFATQGGPLAIAVGLSYNSLDKLDGDLGVGWSYSYEIYLHENSDGTMVLTGGTGKRFYFPNGNGGYVARTGDYSTLTENADGTWAITLKSGLVYQFGSDKKITSITDRNGNSLTVDHSVAGQATVTDPAGRATLINYDATSGKVVTITAPDGGVYDFSYNATSGLLQQVLYPEPSAGAGRPAWQYLYTADGLLEYRIDPEGHIYKYGYTDGKCTRVVDPDGVLDTLGGETGNVVEHSLTFQYDVPAAGQTTLTQKNGGQVIYTYDVTEGVLTQKQDPLSNITSYTYDENGDMVAKTEPGSVTTAYSYDTQGNVLTVTDALNRVTSFTYNGFGQVLTATGPRGTIENTYDANGNLTQVKNLDGSLTGFAYNARGQVTTITDALGRQTLFSYDANGLLQSLTPPSGTSRTFSYDAAGHLLSVTFDGRTVSTTYDALGRPTKVTDPLGYETLYDYNQAGHLVSVTDAEGRPTAYQVDYQGQVTQVLDAQGNSTALAYGSQGCASCSGTGSQLTSLTDAKGQTTSFEYDLAGNLVKEIDPLGNETQYFYEDGRGNLTKRIDAKGQTITYQYDVLDRLTLKTLPGGATVSYSYDDATGYLTGVASDAISYTFTYDSAGRLATVSDSRGYSLAYSYNALGQRTQTTLPGGQTVSYNYDDANRLQSLVGEAGTFTFGYDAAGRRSSLAYPNGLTANYSFDANDRLTELAYSAGTGNLLDIAYPSHDKLGNRLARSEDGQTVSYGYDQLYQLLTATGPEGSENYTYDAVGNRESGPTVKDTVDAAYDHNAVNQMIQGRKFSYSYDANGNQTARLLSHGKIWTQSWDAENHLTQVQWQNGVDSRTVTFVYDPFGRRIEKRVVDVLGGSTTTKIIGYVYDGVDIVLQKEEVVEGGATTTTESRFVHGPGIDEPLALVRGGQSYFYHADGLGSVVAITDGSQAVVQRYGYEGFGLPTPQNTTFSQPYAFTGREWDSEVGLYYYRARYYDPMEGRFISKDPIGFGGGDVNVYRYVQNNPVNFVDPWGLIKWSGTVKQGSFVIYFGASFMVYDFTSECIDNERAIVSVWVVGPSVGIGTKAGESWSATSSTPSGFHDFSDKINPSKFNGVAAVLQGGVAWGLGGSISKVTLGHVFSDGAFIFSGESGYNESASFTLGSSTVMDVKWEKCCFE